MDAETTQERAVRLTKEAMQAIQAGDNPAARQLLEECLALRQASGDRIGVAKTLTNLGIVDIQEGDEEAAQERWEQSLALHQALNNPEGVMRSLANLTGLAHQQGDYARMRALEEQSVALARAGADKAYLVLRLDSLALAAIYQADYDHARAVLQESLGIKRAAGFTERIPFTLKLCADIALAVQDFEPSATLYGAYLKQCASLEQPLPEPEREQIAAALAALQSSLPEAAYRTAYSAGKLMTLEQAIDAVATFCASAAQGSPPA